MTWHGWQVCRSGRPPEAQWLADHEPWTTGMLAQEGLKLFVSGTRAALGIRSGGVVYPVLTGPRDSELDAGARLVLERLSESWCLMGPAPWVEACEAWVPRSHVSHRVHYHFQVREALPALVTEGDFRVAVPEDAEAMFPLQEAYEKEEVLFHADEFQPLASRLAFWKSLKRQEIVALWSQGRPIAKAGTNALTARWAQLGGVFTRPEWRGQGVQKRLLSFLLARLTAQGRGACLFVKKTNTVAASLYRSLGFVDKGDFTIVYGQRHSGVPRFL